MIDLVVYTTEKEPSDVVVFTSYVSGISFENLSNLSWDVGTSQVTSTTGTDATLTIVDSDYAGLMSSAQLAQLNTALQPGWIGSASLTTVGIIGTGTWQGTPITDSYIASAATWGDVSKVGTPVDNQIGVWTGDGTIEGEAKLTWSGTILDITGDITVSGNVDGRDISVDGTKLDTVESNADVTGTTNVTAAGALMDSEVDANIKTLVLPANTTISAFIQTLLDNINQSAAQTTLGVDPAGTDNSTNVTLAGAFDYITITGQEIARNQIDLTTDVTGILPLANTAADMEVSTYDPASIAEQLVGLSASQTLTNKILTIPTITLKQGVSPTPTAEGDIQWDTDDDRLVVGDGVGQKEFLNSSDIVPQAEAESGIATTARFWTAQRVAQAIAAQLPYTTRIVAGVTDTLVVGDTNNVVRYTSATDVTVTVPSGLGDSFICLLMQDGDGQVIWSASGTTIECLNNHTRTGGNGAMATILAIAPDDLRVSGQTGV